MRKSTVFISSILTTFALVILYGVARAYQSYVVNQTAETAIQPNTTVAVVPTDAPTTTLTVITPEEAAQLAAQILGHNDLLSAETSNFNGMDAYLITFTNRDMVYVGLDGQILSVQVAPVVVNVMVPIKNSNQSNNRSDGGGDDDHEDHDD